MYTQIQRFVATLLLFSFFLQSCGNPNWKMVEPTDAGSSGQTSKPKGLTPLQPTNQQEDANEGAMQGGSAPTIARSSEASAAVASKAPYTRPNTLSGEARAHSRSSTSSPAAARSLVVPASKVAQAARPTSVLKKPPTYEAIKPQRAVPDKAPASPHALHSNQLVGAMPPPTSVKPSDRTTPLSRPLQWAAHLPQTEVESRSDDTTHQTPSRAPLSSVAQLYPSAQGHQVCFEAQSGVWQAQVTNVWGCTQKLPVVCAPDQAPEHAIQQLASQAPGQHKYCIHVLETHQPPWAPRVVYVGALGLLGGMPPKKHAGCTYAYSKWKTHSDGSRTCPSGQHHVAAPQASQPRPSSPPSSSVPIAPTTPYAIGGGVTYDPVAMGNNLAGIISLFSSKDHIYREDPSVQQRIQRIEESTQALRRENVEIARREQQREQEDQDRHNAAMRTSEEAWRKIYAEQGEEMKKKYCRKLSVGSIKMDLDNLRRDLADYPLVDSPLPRELEEDIHITLGYIAKEEAELIDFDRRMADIPPEGGTQWSADYYNRKGAERARALLRSIKDDLDAIIAERRAVLVTSEFVSVREVVHRIARARQEEARRQEEQRRQEETLPTPWQGVPFVQPEAPDLAAMLQRNLQLNEPAVGDQVEEDSKMPSLPRVTTFDTPAEAQEAVHTFLERWNLETPAGRTELQGQGQEILKGVEALKKECKQSYRNNKALSRIASYRHGLGSIPRTHTPSKEHLSNVRSLRGALLEALSLPSSALEEVGLRTHPDKEDELYSSDEESPLSDKDRAINAALVKGIGNTLKESAVYLAQSLVNPLSTVENFVNFLTALPELPELLEDYIEEFAEADEEQQAEMLGSLLTEAVLLASPSPKERIAAGISKKLGKAAQRVASKQFKSVSVGYLKKVGIKNLHAFKESHLGTNKNLSQFDVVKHTKTNKLLIIRKATQEVVCNTNMVAK